MNQTMKYRNFNKYGWNSLRFRDIRTNGCRTSSTKQSVKIHDYYDLVVVGGGIIGVTTARNVLLRKKNLKIALLEKESNLGIHQSGCNSGVIHSGIYYTPGSLRSQLCKQGVKKIYEFCNTFNIPYKKCGKIIVATNPIEVNTLQELYIRAVKNDVPDVKLISSEEITQIEPFCKGMMAIHSPHTGIVDYSQVLKTCAEHFQEQGGKIYCNFKVVDIIETKEGNSQASVSEFPITVVGDTEGAAVRCKYVLTCGGLYADKLSALSLCDPVPKIVPFRGEYLKLTKEREKMINGNIYPVPDRRFPFLGVHFTPRMDGSVWLGPNAVLAFSREGYSWLDINTKELMETLKYTGFQKLARKYTSFGLREMLKSIFTDIQLKEIRKFVPTLTRNDIVKGSSGVRAQAVDNEGYLIDDLLLEAGSEGVNKNVIHCRNAPSPAATSSLAISDFITSKLCTEFKL